MGIHVKFFANPSQHNLETQINEWFEHNYFVKKIYYNPKVVPGKTKARYEIMHFAMIEYTDRYEDKKL